MAVTGLLNTRYEAADSNELYAMPAGLPALPAPHL